jgi:hypothetical protein
MGKKVVVSEPFTLHLLSSASLTIHAPLWARRCPGTEGHDSDRALFTGGVPKTAAAATKIASGREQSPSSTGSTVLSVFRSHKQGGA